MAGLWRRVLSSDSGGMSIASQSGTIETMSKQIAVRLPDSLVDWIDERVAAGEASRAVVVKKALMRYQRYLSAVHDAEILAKIDGDPYPELTEWIGNWRNYEPLD